MKRIALVAMIAALTLSGFGDAVDPAVAKTTAETIDFSLFLEISQEVLEVRQERLLTLDDFLARAGDADTVILDTRSESAYAAKHIAGAVHLSFPALTKESLARVLGAKDRTILIYCNNNFADETPEFARKAPPAALNIPTFVTLWAYGYQNVYELGDLVEQSDPRLAFEGDLIEPTTQVAFVPDALR